MPKLTIDHAHSLPIDEVKRRLEDLASRLAAKYSVDASWVTPTEAQVKRTGVSGKITITDAKVSVFLDLAFVLTPLKGKVEQRVKDELKKTLGA
jgi:putative polyhydroxyalkanoate system protein